jgi:mediator of RNA polymerase II transcription subunit 13
MTKGGPGLHVAYCLSADERWITTVWTDQTGKIALTMLYGIQLFHSSAKRSQREIFREIWATSQELMRKVTGRWRLNIVRNGYIAPAELMDWKHVVDGASAAQKHCVVLFLSVTLEPSLRILPPSTQGKAGWAHAPNQYGTPVSTPQAGMTSPDQIVPATPTPGGSATVNAPTPPEHGFDATSEMDLTLVDPAEDSWVVMLPYGVNQSVNTTVLRPALSSGMLMKRKGVKGEGGWSTIEVSLISVMRSSEKPEDLSADELLEEVIKQYRGLVTLSVTRGCVDLSSDCIPWHIATAVRGSRILGDVL